MGFNIGSKIVRATGGSISRAGNYRIHQFPPDIVTDGLVIQLDTGNVGSLAVNDPSHYSLPRMWRAGLSIQF